MNTALPGSWPGLAAMDCDFSKAHVPLCTRPRPPPPALIPTVQPHWFVSHVS